MHPTAVAFFDLAVFMQVAAVRRGRYLGAPGRWVKTTERKIDLKRTPRALWLSIFGPSPFPKTARLARARLSRVPYSQLSLWFDDDGAL